MTRLQRPPRILTVFLCLLIVGIGTALAQNKLIGAMLDDRPAIVLTLTGVVERGAEDVPVEKISRVDAGEVLHWTITSRNEGAVAAQQFKAVGKIPAGTSLLAESVRADGPHVTTYSVDHGENFSPAPIVEEKQPDGAVKLVPAPVSAYTHLRFEWSAPLAAGGRLTASYKVRVK